MTILTVIQAPHPSLNIPSRDVEEFSTSELAKLTEDMIETMKANNLVGIASNQVGSLLRVIIVDFGSKEKSIPIVMVNPKIEYINGKTKNGKTWNWEGCGSIQGKAYLVERVKKIRVTFKNIHGADVGLEFTDEMAYRVQHEVDHINGILISKAGKYRQFKVVK